MGDDALEQFCRAIEGAFYDDGAQAFRESLAAEEAAATGALARATGIDDPALLARLAGLGIRAETLAALTLIPLIETAWADGVMDAQERDAILAGAASSGIGTGSASYRLLEVWTLERPAPELAGVWREFVGEIAKSLTPRECAAFRAKVIGRAYAVANAAGDLRDESPEVSPEELAVLEDLSAAFGAPG